MKRRYFKTPLKCVPSKNISLCLIQAARNGNLIKTKELINTFGLSYSPLWSEGYTLLVEALKNNHTEVAKFILKNGCRVNKTNEQPYETPLHFAVKNDNAEIIEMLLEKGAIIDIKNNFGRTALQYGIYNKDVSRSLLKCGINISNIDNDGISLLHLAVKGGCLQIVERILKRGDNINSVVTNDCKKGYTPLHLAVESGNETVSSLLMSKGADINFKTEEGTTPLHIASKQGCVRIAEELIDNGAFIDSLTDDKQTPLHIAVNNKKQAIIKMLLQHGANINNQDIYDETILHSAVKTVSIVIVKNILQYSPDINNEGNKSSLKASVLECKQSVNERKTIAYALLEYGVIFRTEDVNDPDLWFNAVKNGFLKVVEYLLKQGVGINTFQNSDKETLLLIALKNEQSEVAQLLINYGSDLNVPDKSGKTPIYYAIENKDKNITKLLLSKRANIKDHPNLLFDAIINNDLELVQDLLDHDANIHARDNLNRTPLHFTVYRLRSRAFENASDSSIRGEIAKLLISKGANIDAKTNIGETTLHGAVKNAYKNVVDILLEYGSDINITMHHHQTPLYFSLVSERRKNNKYLITYEGGSFNEIMGDKSRCSMVVYFESKYNYDVDDDDDDIENDNSNLNFVSFVSYEAIVRALHYHIIKMHTANLYVNVINLNLVNLSNFNRFNEKCMKEIINMKGEKINNANVSFYDILIKSTYSLEMLLRNQNVFKALKSGDYEIKFPIYASMIKNNFRKSLERHKLLELNQTILDLLFKNYPLFCTDKILSFLDNEDLKALMNLQPSSCNVAYSSFIKEHNNFFFFS